MRQAFFISTLLLTSLFFKPTFAQFSETNELSLEIRFIESAPKDSFVITNIGNCDINEANLVIDLSESTGKLIFDTSETGAGVEVFQPFEVTEGAIELLSGDSVNDGDTRLALRITNLSAGTRAVFTIDLDDSLPESELGMTRVTGTEMSGATVSLALETELTAVFGLDDNALLTGSSCQ